MDVDRFDRFARALSDGRSRRGILGLASAGLAGLAALTGLGSGFGAGTGLDAEARNKKKKRKKKKRKRRKKRPMNECDANPDTAWCDGACRNILSDSANCGGCDTACSPFYECVNGGCTCSTWNCDGAACGDDNGCGGFCDGPCPPGVHSICNFADGWCFCEYPGECCFDSDCGPGHRCLIDVVDGTIMAMCF